MKLELATLSVAVELGADGEPPTEFLIFRPGLNTSLNGDFLFDEEAARDVMAAFEQHGVRKVVDLEHLSLDDSKPSYDPDPRCWYDLELRDGALLGVRANWLADGERRLREKLQPYLSPTFLFDRETRRIKALHNVAMTAQPALDGAPALAAARVSLVANASERATDMASEADNSKVIESMLKAMGRDPKLPSKMAALLDLDPAASLEEIKMAIGSFEDVLTKLQDVVNGGQGKATEEPKTEDAPATEPAAPPSPDMATATAKYEKLLAGVEQLTARMAKQDAEAAAKVEADERAKLVAERRWPTELLEWAGDKATPLAELKRLSVKFPFVTPPVSDATAGGTGGSTQTAGAHGLDERELRICKEAGCKPEDFAALKAARRS